MDRSGGDSIDSDASYRRDSSNNSGSNITVLPCCPSFFSEAREIMSISL